MNSFCNIYKNPPCNIKFLATVIIPAGYTLSDPLDYYIHLALSDKDLRIDPIYEPEECNMNPQGNCYNSPPQSTCCSPSLLVLNLHGALYANVAVSTFQPVDPITQPSETIFSSDSVIPVDVNLGYTCPNSTCSLQEFLSFNTTVSHAPEFLITNCGYEIFHLPNNPIPFFTALSNPNASRVIQIPYTITITPVFINC